MPISGMRWYAHHIAPPSPQPPNAFTGSLTIARVHTIRAVTPEHTAINSYAARTITSSPARPARAMLRLKPVRSAKTLVGAAELAACARGRGASHGSTS